MHTFFKSDNYLASTTKHVRTTTPSLVVTWF